MIAPAKLRFKLDENLPSAAEVLLREMGHDAETALSERLGGAADSALLDACQAEDRVLVTLDLDFADIRAYPPAEHSGVWVLRPAQQSIEGIVDLLRGAARLLAKEPVVRRLWIVEKER
ncbi:MAG: DUF5615 family PIN-like protein, partial [Rhizobacter sp.]|nr:DUF5615 family PIN-like protein [Rhizobacter sp.]